MKRFCAICGTLVFGILMVGPVQGGLPHSSQRAGHQAAKRAGPQSGHHWRTHRPRPGLLPWQWLPEQVPGTWAYDPDFGPYAPAGGTDEPNAVGYDLNGGDSQPGGDIGGQTVTQPPGTPKVGGQPRLPRSGDSSPQGSGAGPSR